jgi:hypothetical protein
MHRYLILFINAPLADGISQVMNVCARRYRQVATAIWNRHSGDEFASYGSPFNAEGFSHQEARRR